MADTVSARDSVGVTGGAMPTGGVLLAVGLPKGVVVAPDGSGMETTAWVRAGGMHCPLIPSVFDTWVLAMKPRRDDELVELAARFGVEDAAEIVHDLEAAGLLLRIRPETDGASLGDVRVIPLAIGAGNRPSQLDRYQVTNLDANTTLEMDPLSFGLWAEFDGVSTIDAASEGVVRAFPEVRDKQTVLDRVPGLLIALMGARYVFLDRAVDHEAFA